MAKAEFFLRTGRDYTNAFDVARDIFTPTTASTVATLHTSDTDHPSCMEVSAPSDGQGVYHDVSNLMPDCKHAFEFSYKGITSQGIKANLYDQVGNATIHTASLAASTWRNYYKEVTTPANCSVVRIKFYRRHAGNKTQFYIDDVYLQGNALLADPDGYNPDFPDMNFDHRAEGGRIVRDRVGRHGQISLNFPAMTASQAARLFDFAKSKDAGYFDDGAVPAMTALATLYSSTSYNYSGVTVGAAQKAYWTVSSGTPVTAAYFQGASLGDATYARIATDDANFATLAVTITGDYGYHKFNFQATQYATSADVRKITITWKGLAEDLSAVNTDGVELYAWDGTNWVLLDISRTGDKQTLTFHTSRPEIAQQFVDTTANLIRVLVKTRADKIAGSDLTLRTYYVNATVNDDLSVTIDLKNKAVPTAAGSVISVKNLTRATTLILATTANGYRLGDDRKSVIVTADQSAGVVIEAKYNQYYKVVCEQFSKPNVFPGVVTAPYAAVAATLKTLTTVEE